MAILKLGTEPIVKNEGETERALNTKNDQPEDTKRNPSVELINNPIMKSI